MIVNVVVIAIVVALLALCIRSFVKNGGEDCADCTVEGCNASLRAQGKCVAAEDMLKRVDQAVSEGTLDR